MAAPGDVMPARPRYVLAQPTSPAPALACPLQITNFFSFPLFYYVCIGYSGLVVLHAVITTRDGYCVSISNEMVSSAGLLRLCCLCLQGGGLPAQAFPQLGRHGSGHACGRSIHWAGAQL